MHIFLKGFDIHIPTIMISKNDGDYIGRFINSNNVAISFEFVLVLKYYYIYL